MSEWILLNETINNFRIVREYALKSPMGYFFLVETILTGNVDGFSQTMSHVQCNDNQFQSFVLNRQNRAYRKRKK